MRQSRSALATLCLIGLCLSILAPTTLAQPPASGTIPTTLFEWVGDWIEATVDGVALLFVGSEPTGTDGPLPDVGGFPDPFGAAAESSSGEDDSGGSPEIGPHIDPIG